MVEVGLSWANDIFVILLKVYKLILIKSIQTGTTKKHTKLNLQILEVQNASAKMVDKGWAG